MAFEYISPQTGSKYTNVAQIGNWSLSYRKLDGGDEDNEEDDEDDEDVEYRVRVTAEPTWVRRFIEHAPAFEVGSTGNDHASRLVERQDLADVLADAFRSMVTLSL